MLLIPPIARRSPALLAVLALCVTAPAQVADNWTARIELTDDTSATEPGGEYLAPIHATLLPDGRVLIWGWRQGAASVTAPQPRLWPFSAILSTDDLALSPTTPTTISLATNNPPVRYNSVQQNPLQMELDTIFCSGHALEPDGKVFVSGGLRKILINGDNSYALGGGLDYVVRWDSATSTWLPTRLPLLGIGAAGNAAPPYFTGTERYYPTVTKLPDGKMMTTSGAQIIEGSATIAGQTTFFGSELNLGVETWDPATGLRNLLSFDPTQGGTPASPGAVLNSDYTHVFVLPSNVMSGSSSFDVAMFGHSGEPLLMSTSSMPRWSGPFAQRPAAIAQAQPNNGASSLMLPIRLGGANAFPYTRGSMMCVGGGQMMAHLRQFDVWDPTTQNWVFTGNLDVNRHHPSTVLLPDGSVCVVAGHDTPTTQTIRHQQAEYIDLRNGYAVSHGTSNSYTVRGYHAISLLLPDGRVLVGGGRIGGLSSTTAGSILERADLEFLEPPYCSRPRPRILAAPNTVRYNQAFSVRSDRGVREAVLISLGSMTHSIDMNQRYVQLRKTDTVIPLQPVGDAGSDITFSVIQGLRAPANASVAPPGHYMLFVLDNSLTPSIARIVRLVP